MPEPQNNDSFKDLFRPYEDTEMSTLEPSEDIAYYKAVDEAIRAEARQLEVGEG